MWLCTGFFWLCVLASFLASSGLRFPLPNYVALGVLFLGILRDVLWLAAHGAVTLIRTPPEGAGLTKEEELAELRKQRDAAIRMIETLHPSEQKYARQQVDTKYRQELARIMGQ